MNESKHGKHSKVGVVSVTRFILHISVLLSLIRLSCFNFLWHSIQCFLAVNHTEATYVRTNLTFIIFRWWRFQNYKKNGRKANEKRPFFEILCSENSPKCLDRQNLIALIVEAIICIFSKFTRPSTLVLLPSWANVMSFRSNGMNGMIGGCNFPTYVLYYVFKI